MNHGNIFKSSTLKQMYDDYYNSDSRDVRSEIAAMRTMVGALMKKLPEEMTAEALPFEYIEAVVKMNEKVASVVEKYDRIQHRLQTVITADQLNVLLFRMMEIVHEKANLTAQQFMEIAEAMQNLSIERSVHSVGLMKDGVEAYGAQEESNYKVTHTTAKTRYGEDSVVDVTPEKEVEHCEQQHKYLRSRYEDDSLIGQAIREDEEAMRFRTQVNGIEVTMHDELDPFHFEEEIAK